MNIMAIGSPTDDDVAIGTREDGTFAVEGEPKSSMAVLEGITHAQKAFRSYNEICRSIDNVYSAKSAVLGAIDQGLFTDQEYDLFWSSIEILKPAIYAKPPIVVAKPRFSDADSAVKTASEVIERVVNSEFERGDIDQVMLGVRDDLALLNRGVPWVSYESDDEGRKVCIEDLDRDDFLHEPARKWREVGWVARRGWMTRKEMADRFRDTSGEAYQQADFVARPQSREDDYGDELLKAGVWEVWHKADNKVYWVCEGVDVLLDEGDPHLHLAGFFPCPRPAYGTLQRRTLIPVPDYKRYVRVLDQINITTIKIYDLLEQVRMLGLVPGGGEAAQAVQTLLTSPDSMVVVPVAGASLSQGGGDFVQWMPIMDIANTINGLIQARQQLIADFYQLSGISDIMRGATESDETLGAQRLKSQYGSVRVRDKIDEMVRVARDCARIAVEIVCDNFTQEDLLEISQMNIPTRKEMEKALKDLKAAAEREMEDLGDAAEQSAMQAAQSGEQVEQAQMQLQQAQAQLVAKYQPQIEAIAQTVVIEDVMENIKDRRARNMTIDVETDSTVMVDEFAEKQARTEFMQAFGNASATIQPLMASGEAGAKLGGAMLKFSLQPFKANRELDTMIDDFIAAAPEMAAQMQGGQSEEGMEGLAEAEKMKAEAAMERVKAQREADQGKFALQQAEMQRKMGELQQKAQKDQQEAEFKYGQLQLSMSKQEQDFAAKMAKTDAEIDKMRAQTAEILNKIGLDVRKQDLSEYQTMATQQDKAIDRATQQEDKAVDREFRERGESRADMQMEREGEDED